MNQKALAIAFAPKSDWLDHSLIRWAQLIIIAIGCAFWAMAQAQTEAFNADTFGHYALQFKAEFWAGWMASASLLVWIGLLHPQIRWMIAIGAALQAAQYAALGYSAFFTGGEAVIGLHCLAFFAPGFAAIAWRAIRDPDT